MAETIEGEIVGDQGGEKTGSETTTPPEAKPSRRNSWDFLKGRSPEKDVESYDRHPLNFSGSRGLGRMIRGFEGMLGALDYGVVDVVVGGVQLIWEKYGPKKGGGAV